jgi:hypothetical protein
MKNILIFFSTAIPVLLILQPVFAADSNDLQRVVGMQQKQIEKQQQQIDMQQQQLEVQRTMLLDMQQKLEGLTGPASLQVAIAKEKTTAGKAIKTIARRTDTNTNRRDKEHPDEEWKGSFGVKGANTRMKIGGFAELDVIHDTDAIASKGQFVTSTIATDGAAKNDGADGQTNFSVNPTRIYLETRTPIEKYKVTTFVSMDFYGDAMDVSPEPRMRQAYGEISNILFGGDIMAGQAWTTFADLEAFPNVLDFQGPNSFFGTRQPLLRWTRGVGKGLKLMIAAETPDNHIIEEADSLTAWPDGVVSMVWDETAFHLMGSFIGRDLRSSYEDGPTETAFGWGTSISGKVKMPFIAAKDFMTFSATYGEGIGSNFNDQPLDAIFDTNNSKLEAVPVFGYFVSYEHSWSPQLNSTVVYGFLEADNLDFQSSDSFKETQYSSANLAWLPVQNLLIGIEGLWGKREDKDGTDGSDFRTLFTTKYSF